MDKNLENEMVMLNLQSRLSQRHRSRQVSSLIVQKKSLFVNSGRLAASLSEISVMLGVLSSTPSKEMKEGCSSDSQSFAREAFRWVDLY